MKVPEVFVKVIKEEPIDIDEQENVENWIEGTFVYKGTQEQRDEQQVDNRKFEKSKPNIQFDIVDEKADIITINAVDAKADDEIDFMEDLNSREKMRPTILQHGKFLAACPKCQQTFKSKGAYTRHVSTGVCAPLGSSMLCTMCSMEFKTMDELHAHLNIHRENRFFCKKLCGASFETLILCEEHESIQHLIRNNKCYICKLKFRAFNFLQEHRKLHKDLKHVVCSHCRSWFGSHSELVLHWRENADECGRLLSSSMVALGKLRERSGYDSDNSLAPKDRKRSRKQQHVQRKITEDESGIIEQVELKIGKSEGTDIGHEQRNIMDGESDSMERVEIKLEDFEINDSWQEQRKVLENESGSIVRADDIEIKQELLYDDTDYCMELTIEPEVCIKTEIELEDERITTSEGVVVKTEPGTEACALTKAVAQTVTPPVRQFANPIVLNPSTASQETLPQLRLKPSSGKLQLHKLPAHLKLVRLPPQSRMQLIPLPGYQSKSPTTKPPNSINLGNPSMLYRFMPMVQIPNPQPMSLNADQTAAVKSITIAEENVIRSASGLPIKKELSGLQELQQYFAETDRRAKIEERRLCVIPNAVLESIHCLPEKRRLIEDMLQQIREASGETLADQSILTTTTVAQPEPLASVKCASTGSSGADDISHDSFASAITANSSASSIVEPANIEKTTPAPDVESVSNAAATTLVPVPQRKTHRIEYTCPNCSRTFSSRGQLNDHRRGNCSRIRLYPCGTCGKKFFSSSTLRTHISIHTGELPYKCKYCDAHFRTRGQVGVHHRRHTGERPFKCQICSQTFTHRETLISHLSRHIGIKRYKCYACDKHFSCISGLTIHRENRPETCGQVALNSRAVGPRVRVVRGNVYFEPQPIINPYLRTQDPQDVLLEIKNTNTNSNTNSN